MRVQIANNIGSAFTLASLVFYAFIPSALAWDFKAGRDGRSGRPFAIIQQWSQEERAIIGIECQNGLESGMLGILLANPYAKMSTKKTRAITFKIGDSAPIKISVKRENNPNYTNYVLVTENQINSGLFGKLVEKLQSVPGEIRVIFDDRNQFVFPDSGRQSVVKEWLNKCLSDQKS